MSEIWSVWYLIGAALVFWMQAGFAMVEAGFTRAKNTGNIIMKNLMDFCIGTVVFILIGFSLLMGEDLLGCGALPCRGRSARAVLRHLPQLSGEVRGGGQGHHRADQLRSLP